MDKRKFAVIGCGHAHIDIFIGEMLAMGHACIRIYDPAHPELTRTFAEKYGIAISDDRESLLQEADLLGSSAINNEKIDVIEACARLGKPVMIDKPAVTNRRDLERLEAAAGGIEIGMLLTERFHPPVYTLKRLVEQGALGRLLSVNMRKPHLLNPGKRPSWFFSKEQNGGILIDLLIHDYDLLRWFTGSEVKASDGYMAKTILPEHPGFYDMTSVQVLMENNLVAQLYADWFTPSTSWTWGDGRIFVTGTEGVAELRSAGDPFIDTQEALLLLTTNDSPPQRVELEQPAQTITEDFLRRIAGGTSILTNRDILSASKAVIDADEDIRILRSETGGS